MNETVLNVKCVLKNTAKKTGRFLLSVFLAALSIGLGFEYFIVPAYKAASILTYLIVTITTAGIIGLYYTLLSFQRKKPVIASGLLVMLLMFFLSMTPYAGHFDTPSVILLYSGTIVLVSTACVLFCSGKYRVYFPTWRHTFLYCLIVLYSTMAVSYNLVFQGLDIPLVPQAVPFCIAIFLILFCSLLAFLFLTETLAECWQHSDKTISVSKQKKAVFWLQLFCIPATVFTLWALVYFPATMSPDSIQEWNMATGISTMNTWNPVVHILFIRWSTVFAVSPFAPIAIQIAALSAVIASSALFLHNYGLSKKQTIGYVVLYTLLPNNGIYSVTLWKDVAYAIAVFGLVLSLAKILVVPSYSKMQLAFLAVAIYLSAFMRHNGIVVAIVISVIVSVFYLKKLLRAVPAIALIAIAITQMAIGRAYGMDSYNLIATGSPIHGIGAVFYYGGELDSKTYNWATKTVDAKDWVRLYSPFSAGDYTFIPELMQETSTTELLEYYIRAFIKNPGIMTNERLMNADINWTVFHGTHPGSWNYRYQTEIASNTVGLTQSHGPLQQYINNMLANSVKIKCIDALLWRNGIYIILLLASIYLLLLKGKFAFVLPALPILVNFLFMFLGSNSQDFRYSFLTNLTFPFLYIFWLLHLHETKAKAPVMVSQQLVEVPD